jgi:hypothetical protein
MVTPSQNPMTHAGLVSLLLVFEFRTVQYKPVYLSPERKEW